MRSQRVAAPGGVDKHRVLIRAAGRSGLEAVAGLVGQAGGVDDGRVGGGFHLRADRGDLAVSDEQFTIRNDAQFAQGLAAARALGAGEGALEMPAVPAQIQATQTKGAPLGMVTLDHTVGEFLLTVEQVNIPAQTQEFSINMANDRFWSAPMKQYIKDFQVEELGQIYLYPLHG